MSVLHELPLDIIALICTLQPTIIPALSAINTAMHFILGARTAPNPVYTAWMQYRFNCDMEVRRAAQLYNLPLYRHLHPYFDGVDVSSGVALCELTPQDVFNDHVNNLLYHSTGVTDDGNEFVFLVRNVDKLCVYLKTLGRRREDAPTVNLKMATMIIVALTSAEMFDELVVFCKLHPKLTVQVANFLKNTFWFADDDDSVAESAVYFASAVAGLAYVTKTLSFALTELLRKHVMIAFLLGRGYVGPSMLTDSQRFACVNLYACTNFYNLHTEVSADDLRLTEMAEEHWKCQPPVLWSRKILLLRTPPLELLTAMWRCDLGVIRDLLIGQPPFNDTSMPRRCILLKHYRLTDQLYKFLDDPTCIKSLVAVHKQYPFSHDMIDKAYHYFNDQPVPVLMMVSRALKEIFVGEWDRVKMVYKDTPMYDFLLWGVE